MFLVKRLNKNEIGLLRLILADYENHSVSLGEIALLIHKHFLNPAYLRADMIQLSKSQLKILDLPESKFPTLCRFVNELSLAWTLKPIKLYLPNLSSLVKIALPSPRREKDLMSVEHHISKFKVTDVGNGLLVTRLVIDGKSYSSDGNNFSKFLTLYFDTLAGDINYIEADIFKVYIGLMQLALTRKFRHLPIARLGTIDVETYKSLPNLVIVNYPLSDDSKDVDAQKLRARYGDQDNISVEFIVDVNYLLVRINSQHDLMIDISVDVNLEHKIVYCIMLVNCLGFSFSGNLVPHLLTAFEEANESDFNLFEILGLE